MRTLLLLDNLSFEHFKKLVPQLIDLQARQNSPIFQNIILPQHRFNQHAYKPGIFRAVLITLLKTKTKYYEN